MCFRQGCWGRLVRTLVSEAGLSSLYGMLEDELEFLADLAAHIYAAGISLSPLVLLNRLSRWRAAERELPMPLSGLIDAALSGEVAELGSVGSSMNRWAEARCTGAHQEDDHAAREIAQHVAAEWGEHWPLYWAEWLLPSEICRLERQNPVAVHRMDAWLRGSVREWAG